MINGTFYRPIDPKSRSLSLEARHSISLEIAKRRRQDCATSIFMPKTNAKPQTNPFKMSSDRESTTKSTRKPPRKSKLQHPESFPVRVPPHSRLQPRPMQQNLKAEIAKPATEDDARARQLNGPNDEQHVHLKQKLQKPQLQQLQQKQSIPLHNSFQRTHAPTPKANQKYYAERLTAQNDASSDNDFELEDNSEFTQQIVRRKSKLSSLKTLRANSAVDALQNVPPPPPPAAAAAATACSAQKMKQELERQQSLLRMAIKAARKARNGAAKLFSGRNYTKMMPTPKLMLEDEAERSSTEYLKLQAQAYERHEGGLAAKPVLDECGRRSLPNKPKVNKPKKSKTAPAARNSMSKAKARANSEKIAATNKPPTSETPAAPQPAAYAGDACTNYAQQFESYYQCCPCPGMHVSNERPPTLGPPEQSPAPPNNDNNSYIYESMRPACNYCCVQEEELTIEQANPTLAPASEHGAAACDAAEWPQQHQMPQDFSASFQRQNEYADRSDIVGSFMTSSTAASVSTAAPSEMPQATEEQSPQFMRSTEISLEKTYMQEMPQSAHASQRESLSMSVDQQQQQQQQEVEQQPNHCDMFPPATSYNAEQRQSFGKQRQQSMPPRSPPRSPPHRFPAQANPWFAGNNNPNFYPQHGACYGCNICPPLGPSIYSTCMPWWYPPYQTACCSPLEMMYPPLQQQQQQQAQQHFYNPQPYSNNFGRYSK